MKALIVDDEEHVIEAIKILGDWDSLGIKEIYSAMDGEDAIQIIKEVHPQIILTDMKMTKINGVDLLKWIHQHAPFSKTIVISGYSNFTYVQQAIRFGGMDYILKPIDQTLINQALLKAVTRWKNEFTQRNKNTQWNQAEPIFWSKKILNLIEEPKDDSKELKKIIEHFQLNQDKKNTVKICVLRIQELTGMMKKEFGNDISLLAFSITNVCNEIINRHRVAGYSFENFKKKREIVLLFWNNYKKCLTIIETIYECINELFGSYFVMGVGEVCQFPFETKKTYEQSVKAIARRNLLNQRRKIYMYKKKKEDRFHLLLPEWDRRIITAIKSNQEKELYECIDQLLNCLTEKELLTENDIRVFVDEYKIFRKKWIIELIQKQNSIFTKLYRSFNLEVKHIKAIETIGLLHIKKVIKQDLGAILETYNKVRGEINNPILEIKKYIDNTYMEDISLTSISEHYYLSKEHISRSFKKYFQSNITQYIAELRIEQAKKLMRNKMLSINEIAKMVGYKDAKYFSKVFKKMTELTPNAYRKKMM